ncbi:MAG TPA: transcriptional regulator, partial [Pyrinomonadaceae bacterium]
MTSPVKHLYEFDRFTLDASERLLLRGGKPVHLTPKEFETLLALVRGAGRVIRKEELLKEIWPDTFVGEATLAQNVFTLRKALGEPSGGGAFVETVPRRGYRFAVEVRERHEGAGEVVKGQDGAHAFAAAVVEDEGRAFVNAPAAPAHEAGGRHLPSPEEDAGALPAPPDVRAREPRNGHAPTAQSSANAAPGAGGRAADGHPVRAAVIIASVVFVSVAALVYLIYRTSVRPDVDRARTPAPAAFPNMKLTRLPVTGAVAEAVIS